ncbi:TetR/AcrR family transcriptional regulator [Cellulomonas sp. S1-8]|uniref:TetR/AcrR family transcriptional regulator n=1 Tax=Cellulomonas sp. S1-8 TaxID=2904790 RepID=UPI002244DE17|nr:TetR/AcrR family transcriptional regulator C-terminal domain-containing protein [Cellulomonas sp. S1-8]UZN04751.1 TetR/AcrR family transcriptional regulator C-terminal domain-containing protein [Cellulomonas sp. S1-8]
MARRVVRERLSRELIVDVAMSLADDEGLEAVTMRRVATALHCEAMSLYHHVPGKDALLAALTDRVVGLVVEVSVQVTASTWIETVRERCLMAREVLLQHPWGPSVLTSSTQMPPSAWVLYEHLLATLASAGFDDDLAHRAVHALGSMLFGFSTELFEPDGGAEPPDEATMAVIAAQMPHLARLAAAVVHETDGALSGCDTRAEFVFTLGLVLDGLEQERARRAGGPSSSV